MVAVFDGRHDHAAYQELATKLQEEAANDFLLHENTVWGLQAGVEGFEPHPLDQYVLTADLGLGGN